MSFVQIRRLLRRGGGGRFKATIALLITTIVLLLFLHSTWFYDSLRSDSVIGNERFLHVSKCPACYGIEICPHFTNVTFSNFNTSNSIFDGSLWNHIASYVFRNWFNAKNVYYAMLKGQKVVLKKLAQNWELDQFDRAVLELKAERTQNPYNYDSKLLNVGATLTSLVTVRINKEKAIITDEYKSLYRLLRDVQSKMATPELFPDAIYCKNWRFFQLALQKYTHDDDNNADKVSNLLTSLLINAEPVIMRVFSESSLKDRFPKYLGSCGRVIVENYVGDTLDHYRTTPWPRRLRLALDLLRFAKQMTSNSLDMNLYWTDVSFENFAVTSDNRIVLVDVEGIVIVDSNSTDLRRHVIHSNTFGNDDTSKGLQFSLDDLCSYGTTDHNIYAVCKCFLSSNPCSSGIPGGLLWGTSEEIEKQWNLQALVRECVVGSNRILVSNKLTKTMEGIMTWLSK